MSDCKVFLLIYLTHKVETRFHENREKVLFRSEGLQQANIKQRPAESSQNLAIPFENRPLQQTTLSNAPSTSSRSSRSFPFNMKAQIYVLVVLGLALRLTQAMAFHPSNPQTIANLSSSNSDCQNLTADLQQDLTSAQLDQARCITDLQDSRKDLRDKADNYAEIDKVTRTFLKLGREAYRVCNGDGRRKNCEKQPCIWGWQDMDIVCDFAFEVPNYQDEINRLGLLVGT